MGRSTKWQDMDEADRLPHGVTRTGYDHTSQQYTFTTAEGEELQGQPGRRFGELRRLGPSCRSATAPAAFTSGWSETQYGVRPQTSGVSLASSYVTMYAESIDQESSPRRPSDPAMELVVRPCSSVYSEVSPVSTRRRGSFSGSTSSPPNVSPLSSVSTSLPFSRRPVPIYGLPTITSPAPRPLTPIPADNNRNLPNLPLSNNANPQGNRAGNLRRPPGIRRHISVPIPLHRPSQQPIQQRPSLPLPSERRLPPQLAQLEESEGLRGGLRRVNGLRGDRGERLRLRQRQVVFVEQQKQGAQQQEQEIEPQVPGVMGQQGLAQASVVRVPLKKVTMGMAAKELWRDTVAYFNHLLTSALRRSSQALKRKNEKRLARLHREEEKGHLEFLEWLEAANSRMQKKDLGGKKVQS